ncbi:hypothetical protein J4H92_02890 [Leucobacter weissii]|uniref:Uncharacterized protein n=1 Tax=Leucobacter weissii TaxID=1983706 RepID=A0A939S529_9MICO|nr:hypothetical protein [Leucobacter weissii]MBO1900894.1 hypothetical protein [Leucobacter weissii]
MNSPHPAQDRARTLAHDAELREQLALLLGQADRRQIWTLYLSREHRILDPVMPMGDHPPVPQHLCRTADLGIVPFSCVLVERVDRVREAVGASSLVFVWERPGPPKPSGTDLSWAREVVAEGERRELRIRAQFLLHSGGVRQLLPAEWS